MASAPTYQHGPESQRQPGVPQGQVTHFQHVSAIFPGAGRDYCLPLAHSQGASSAAARVSPGWRG
jgi:hypothetical protein